MVAELPQFQKASRRYAADFINRALSGPRGPSLLKLIAHENGHYRAIFRQDYFDLKTGAARPSRSQWNTLKKKLKRRDRRVFVFRDYGHIDGAKYQISPAQGPCLFLDFGFLLE